MTDLGVKWRRPGRAGVELSPRQRADLAAFVTREATAIAYRALLSEIDAGALHPRAAFGWRSMLPRVRLHGAVDAGGKDMKIRDLSENFPGLELPA